MNDVDLGLLWASLAASVLTAVVVMGATLAYSLLRRRHDVVDVAWGMGFAAIAVVTGTAALSAGSLGRRWLLLAMTLMWGGRLAVHIGRRNRGRPDDPRYVELLSESSGSAALVLARKIFAPQAVVMVLVSMPITVGMATAGGLQWWAWAGVLVWAVGVGFEAVGDQQLARFKSDPARQGQVLDTGLWRYTRHPNYFGDACVWWGIWLVSAASWLGLATVFAPALMTWFLTSKTGKPLTEKSMTASKPGYADYVARTSGFIPRPPRRS